MTHKVFSSSQSAYQSLNDNYAVNMFQYPYSVPGFAVGHQWNAIAPDHQHGGVYNYYYPNWYHQKKMSHPRRKKPFTIRAILGLKDNGEQDDNSECFPSENLLPPRLTPEPVQMPSSKCFDNGFPHGVETVSSSDSYNMSSDPAICRLSPPCLELQSPNNCRSSDDGLSPNRKPKRNRTMFTPYQLEKLELEFQRTQYIVGDARIQFASELNLTENQVKIWFQNRRIKQRKQIQEEQQAQLAKLKKMKAEEKESDSDSDFNSSQISSSCSSSDECHLQRSV